MIVLYHHSEASELGAELSGIMLYRVTAQSRTDGRLVTKKLACKVSRITLAILVAHIAK